MSIKRRALVFHYRRLMGPEAWRKFVTGLTLGAVTGAFAGLALVALLPAAVALSDQKVVWGLSFGQWLITLAVFGLIAAAADFLGSRTGYFGALGFIRQTHHAIGDQVAKLPLSWFGADSAGSLSRMVTQEMMSLAQSAARFSYELVINSVAAVLVGLGGWLWDWRLGLLLTVAAPLFALVLGVSRRLLDAGQRIAEPTEEELAARIIEFTKCQGALRACHIGESYPQLRDALDANRQGLRRGLILAAAGDLLSGVVVQLIVVAMIVLTVMLTVNGVFQPLEAVVTIGMSLRFTTMLTTIGESLIGVENRRQLMNRVDEVMDAELLPEVETSSEMTDPGSVELREVEFGYQDEITVLNGLSLQVPAHTMCAIVGPSGSGKTTIARLIARFYDVTGGSILVGGADIRELTTSDLMSQLSMVFQDVFLFDDTLIANIRVGNPQAGDDEVHWAARLAGVDEIVQRLPGGWQARVGEGGRALSGGERQRVSIARALLKRAPIVLFDEATSALDAENEANIVAAMAELRRTSTLIVIAHKMETIAQADQVIVLGADGRIAQQGRHEELVGITGPYQDFWHYRNQAAGWSLVEADAANAEEMG